LLLLGQLLIFILDIFSHLKGSIMARKKRSVKSFKTAAIHTNMQQTIKGGRQASPSGAGSLVSSIWDSVDIRGHYFANEYEGITGNNSGVG
jgi:hypothetical protein